MKSFEETLGPVSTEWVGEGLITDEQRTAILRRHPLPAGGGSRFVAVLSTVGALLFVAGISLIVKSNWEVLGDWVKIGGLVGLMVAAYAAGWRLKMASGYSKMGDAFLMAGALLFLLGIALVSQVFHLNARPASGVMWWWLGIVAVPWLTGSKGAQFVSVVALLVWLGMEMETAGSWIEIGMRRHDTTAPLVVFFGLGLALWLSGLGLSGGRWINFAGLHEKLGVIVVCGSLYWLGFLRHFWEWQRGDPEAFVFSGAFALSFVLAVAGGVVAWRASRRETGALAPWMGAACVVVAGIIVGGSFGGSGWLWSAAAWLSLFALSIAIVRVGLETGREGWVNLGIAFIALNVITRYFDLFGTMLEGGVFFIVTGVLVAGLGVYLEKKRRSLLATLRKEVGV